MTQELIIIRGLPGSGKSTLAKLMRSFDCYEYMDVSWFETDMFFMQAKEGTWAAKENISYHDQAGWAEEFEYKFDASRLTEAHAWCQHSVREKLKDPHAIVIVSNTFTRIWEMQPYLDMAKEFGAKVTVLTCEGNYGNVHNVPDETIQKMKNRWEKYDG